MYYLVQENIYNEPHYPLLIKTLERYHIPYETVYVIPFMTECEIKTDRKDIFVFGGFTLAAIAPKYGWKPGSLYNENHDFEIYAPKFGLENMLNGDGFLINFSDPIPIDEDRFFVRPAGDTKAFRADVYTREKWADFSVIIEGPDLEHNFTSKTRILVSSTKNIQQEVRCWIVGGKVVTTSMYKMGSRVVYENYDHQTEYRDFAQSMVDKYQPAEAFVIDIALADNKLSVIEVNNINCAGFYHCNMNKLIEALETHFI